MVKKQLTARTSASGFKERMARMAVNMNSVGKISKAIGDAVEGYDIETFKVEVTDEKIVVNMIANKTKTPVVSHQK